MQGAETSGALTETEKPEPDIQIPTTLPKDWKETAAYIGVLLIVVVSGYCFLPKMVPILHEILV